MREGIHNLAKEHISYLLVPKKTTLEESIEEFSDKLFQKDEHYTVDVISA